MMNKARTIKQIVEPTSVVEGAGVRLQRSIGGETVNYLDPFLLFDHFGSPDAEDYQAGFPMHPHRGIETVTYMLKGEVQHRDTLGNAGTIRAGEVQWMTAGGGILHEEMPQVRPEGNAGFQLWVNLPAEKKMAPPRYQDFSADHIPEMEKDNGRKIRVIAGEVEGVKGPVQGIAANPTYLDVAIPAQGSFAQPVPSGHSAFVYVFEGSVMIQSESSNSHDWVTSPKLVVLGEGDFVDVKAGDQGARLLLVSAQPLQEPIARYGPFVMNTQEEIEEALRDLRQGTFIRSEKRS